MAAKHASETAKSEKVFGQARKHPKMFRVGLYAHVSTSTNRPSRYRSAPYANMPPAGLDHRLASEGGGFWRFATATAGEVTGRGAPPRDRCRVGVAIGSLGAVGGGPARDTPGTVPSGRRFRLSTEALDLTTPAGRAMATLLAVFAEFEREILRERVRAGLAHARQNGKRLGRPQSAALQTGQVRKLYRAGVSKSEIARRSQIGRTSVRRILEAKL